MTPRRKKSLLKTLRQIKYDLDIHNYTKALGGCNVLTTVGFGVPPFSPAYWHAKSMQSALYYHEAGYNSLKKVQRQWHWINGQVRRTIPAD